MVHPLTVESIAWVSEIKNALSLPLFLWALSRYIQFDASDEKSAYGQSLLLYVAAMLSKTSVVMLPLVLLLYCWVQAAGNHAAGPHAHGAVLRTGSDPGNGHDLHADADAHLPVARAANSF